MPGIDPERWKRISALLDEVLTLDDPSARAALLDALAAREPDVAGELRGLLVAREAASREGFLATPPVALPSGPQAGGTLGAYTLERPIGAGGMGEVWLARRSDGRYEGQAAVKFLDVSRVGPASHARFRREGEILARLAHPNISRLLDAGVTQEGRPYLVLEYVEGEPIDQACDQRRLGVTERVRLFLDVLSAVAHAHVHLVVHRDIKPSNVMLARDGTVKLLDFGIAKLMEEAPEAGAATLTREVGPLTPQFAAPEQVTGGAVTTSTDVFALGTLLYLLLTGRHPSGLNRATPAEYVQALLRFEPALASTMAGDAELKRALSGDLDNILARALAADPAKRFATAAAFADDLRRHLNHEPVLAREGTLPYRAARFVRRNRAATALGTVAALAVVAGLAVSMREARDARRQRAAALQQLHIAEATNSFTSYLLSSTGSTGTSFTAAELLQRGEEVAERQLAKDSPLRVHLLLDLAQHYHHAEDPAAAERLTTEALALAKTSGGPLVRAQAACRLGFLKTFSGDLDEGARLMALGMASLEELDDPELAGATCLVEDSLVARARNELKRAIASATKARDIALANPETPPDQLLDALSALATAESADGQAAAAIESYRALDASFRSSGRDRTGGAAVALGNRAIHLFNAGQVTEAVEVARRVVELDRALDPSSGAKPGSLTSLSNGLTALGRYDEAEPLLDEAVAKARAHKMTTWIPLLLSARTVLYSEEGDVHRLEAALPELEAALKEAFEPRHWAQSLLGLSRGRLYLMRGEPERALPEIDAAIELTRLSMSAGKGFQPTRTQLDGLTHRGLQTRAEALSALGRFAEAEAAAQESVRLAESSMGGVKYSYRCGQAYRVLAAAYEAAGDREKALGLWQKAYDNYLNTIGAAGPKTVLAAGKLGKGSARSPG
jgi:serine/threonine-protein kinase